MEKIVIVAGTFNQARRYANKLHLAPPDYIYASNPDVLYGLRHPVVFFIGNYYARVDFEEIKAALGPSDPSCFALTEL